MPANAAIVPITAPGTTPLPKAAWNTLLIAPTNTPSSAAYASTSGGLTTRLNEFTIARANPPRAPTSEIA